MNKLVSILILVVALSACSTMVADNPKIIQLSGTEKAKALALAEHRQIVGMKMSRVQAQYQADMNRLNEETQQINLESQQLCFDVHKSHSLPPDANYGLDELNARLIRH